MKKGSIVYLSAIEEGDLKQLKEWRNIESFKKHFREYRDINDNMQMKWFLKRGNEALLRVQAIKYG